MKRTRSTKYGSSSTTKRPRAYGTKRTYKSLKRYARRKNAIPRTIVSTGLGFPKKMMMTHKYQETISLSIPLGVVMQKYFISANSMYDPNATSTGHQPLYFDQMTALYDHYVVVGSKITVTFPPAIDSNLNIGIYVDDDASNSLTSSDTVAEQSLAVRRLMTPTAVRPVTITKKWSAKKYFGGSILANTDLQGTVSANPVEQSFFMIYAQSQVSPSATYSYNPIVSVEYIVIWKELKEVAGS